MAQYTAAQHPPEPEPTILLSGSRDELSGFHMQTRYPELLNGRNLNQLRNLFSLEMNDPGE